MVTEVKGLVRAARLEDLQRAGRLALQVNGHTLALFTHGDEVYAVDNRCPHMGFPLHRGTVHDGILTCHWHHARFDLRSGGTFDPWADDVRIFPVEVREGEIWIDLAARSDMVAHHRARLREGLERNISLVIAKAAIALTAGGVPAPEPFRIGLDFGALYRRNGWGQGLTILTCVMNLLPSLEDTDRPLALYHGLSAVAAEADGDPPRFSLRPLPDTTADVDVLARWFRQFVEVRDAEGAERAIVSAVRAGADHRQMADFLFAAATDHRYIQIGHTLDFINKALEALDLAGWEVAEPVLASLAAGFAEADRMEESNAWRNPVDLIDLLEDAFAELDAALDAGRRLRGQWGGRKDLTGVLLGEDPQTIVRSLIGALQAGAGEVELAATVAHAAALRIARFPTSNEFGDWDTALHTFTFANAVQQGLRRSPSPALVRGVFDAAMSVYLDRFLNVPAVSLPEPREAGADPRALLEEFDGLLDQQQRVNQAGSLAARYLAGDGEVGALLAKIGALLLREDRNFHTIQMVEAAARQFQTQPDPAAGRHALVAACRYLAAHAPTMRAQGQTYRIASRLHRGERLFEEESSGE